MKIAIYSTKDFERPYLENTGGKQHHLHFLKESLHAGTAALAKDCEAISIFAGDDASAPVLEALHRSGVRNIAIRAAGYDNVDLNEAHRLGIRVANVPAYSPYAIAEHAAALMLALNRKLIQADRQVQVHNFTVGGLMGFDMHGKTVGIIGTGKIGSVAARIMHGFGCKLLAHDAVKNTALEQDCDLRYVSLEALYAGSDIITLHIPFTKQTAQLINSRAIAQMRRGVMLINTARGGVVHTADVLAGLKDGHIGAFGADVYEGERGVFFYDRSADDLQDPLLEALLAMPNVLVTPHQGFATHEAMSNIADTTFFNIGCWAAGDDNPNEL